MHPALIQTYWQATALLLCASLAGWSPGLPAVLAVNAAQCVHFLLWRRSLRPLDVQVRLLFFSLLVLAATVPALHGLIALQFAGITARLCVDYCLAARLLLLMPWNRKHRLTLAAVARVLFMPPRPGPIQPRWSP